MTSSADSADRLRIRRAQPDDVPAILALMAAGAVDPDREAGATEEDYRRAFAAVDGDPNQLLLVAETDAEGVLGTMQLSFVPGLSYRGGWRFMIENVHVSPAHRSRGHGAAMMEWGFAEGRRRGCVLAQLTSHKTRKKAHRFYARLGFVASHEGLKRPL